MEEGTTRGKETRAFLQVVEKECEKRDFSDRPRSSPDSFSLSLPMLKCSIYDFVALPVCCTATTVVRVANYFKSLQVCDL